MLIAAVCDGAGSAGHSDIGSELAASVIVEQAASYFLAGARTADLSREIVATWLKLLVDQLTLRAGSDGNELKDYASTLLLAIIGVQDAVFAQIGDGAIVVSHGAEDGWSWVFWPQHGDYANQTVFVLSANAIDTMDFCVASRRIDELAIFSDGIERLVLHGVTKGVNEPFFNEMFVPVRSSRIEGLNRELSEELELYLASSAINRRTNDDRTLFLATRSLTEPPEL